MLVDLVKVQTKDNLNLNGFLIECEKDKPIVLFIHGYQTDFYSHQFVISIAEKLQENNFGFLSMQHRGTGLTTEFITTEGEGRMIGSAHEKLEEVYLDIDAWLKFLLGRGYKNIVLAGHSLGTFKIVRYLSEGEFKDKVESLILLCPFDMYGEVEVRTNGDWRELIKIIKQKVDEGNGDEYVPKEWKEGDVTYQTIYSWYSGSEFCHIFDFHDKNYHSDLLQKIDLPTKVIVGTHDDSFHPTNFDKPQEALDGLLNNLKNSSGKLIEDARHVFTGYEEEVAEEILNFLDKK